MKRHFAFVFVAMTMLLSAVAWFTPSARADTTAVTEHKTITRAHLVDGNEDVVDTRHFSVTVDNTTSLRNFQEIGVSWSGAHPTGGIIADQNSGDARGEEYPVVLLECRGSGDIDPSTCWTATAAERYQESFNTAFPPARVDRYATAAERQAVAGAPDPRPQNCLSPAPTERWVPFAGANGTVYAGGSGGCGGMAPEAANVGGLSLPSNTTYGVTSPDGTGEAKFDVWTGENNASLGCSSTVPCALVVVPIMGISCDVAGEGLPAADRPNEDQKADADALCRKSGQFQPGQVVSPTGRFDVAVSGALWWSASNWRNRITVPLSFAPPSNACDVVSNADGIDIYGSELMTQAAIQWAPHFCLDSKLFKVKHVQTAEPAARTLLGNASIDAAFSSGVPDEPYKRPVVNAPVAVTGFAISFAVDDAKGHALTTLRLTPRLLAKLLTQSYPAVNALKEEYAALAKNPLNVSLDPEFQTLNPAVTKGVAASESASTLLSLSSDSDVLSALTAYIDADPDARAWLNGTPDPWGMVVNPNYKAIALPTASWPLLDSFEPPKMYASDTNDCLYNNPVPYLPLIAAPMARLAPIAQAMQFALANSQTVCQQRAEGSSEGEKLVALGRQTPGFRFMLGLTSLADVHRYGLDAASLATQGDNFVAPSAESLRAATAMLKPDAATNTWPIPYASLRSQAAGAAAYPGTMVVYASVPTAGLSSKDAGNYAAFLRYVTTDGQTPGAEVGKLPDGYLPLTAANNLGGMATYAAAAADAIAAQGGVVPSALAAAAAASNGGGGANAASTGPVGGASGRRASGGSSGTFANAGASTPAPQTTVARLAQAVGNTLGAVSRFTGTIFPELLGVAVAAALLSGGLFGFGRLRART